ncbi:protein LBH isoform X6 [Pelodiscus sinensis]|uniref:protein LBH isoform X6 n=1 Tax=Pelodiscus sinensis TaxID=13735 RepID=UPI003F6A6954
MSVFFPIHCPDYLRSAEMTEVMMNTTSMDEIGLSPRKDGLSYQIGRRLLHRNGRCPSSPCDWGLVSGWLFKLSQVASHQDSQISDLTKFRFFFSFKYLSYYLWKIMEYRSDSRRLEKCTYTVHL